MNPANPAAGRISLTMGPILFHWGADRWVDFYARLADESPIDAVCIGEVVCSKRAPFYEDVLARSVERLERAGKTVLFSTLGLVTLPRERRDSARLVRGGAGLEINDLTALAYLEKGRSFRIGPLVNVYNESTLRFLALLGASSVCLPPELPAAAVDVLAATARTLDVGCEIWAFGRVPLAISSRCYHARIDGLSKDTCQFGCARDPDGRDVDTADGKSFLAINGVQTMSHSYCNLVADTDHLAAAGVTSLRLSPHSCDMVAVSRIFRDRLDGRVDGEEALARTAALCPAISFANGFLFGPTGADMANRKHAPLPETVDRGAPPGAH